MKCPIDNTDLVISDRQGIEIDYCPKCRGIWLDRGELDKIIDRTNEALGASDNYNRDDAPRRDVQPERRDDYYNSYDYKKRKKKSFFDDLFDF